MSEKKLVIVIGSDHAGYNLKTHLISFLQKKGYETIDIGTDSPQRSVDYPQYAEKAGKMIANGEAQLGILVCGSGIGMSIAANKIHGIRAACVHDVTTARLAKEHNDANIITIGARLIAPELAEEIVRSFLEATFEPRHLNRIKQIAEMERS